MFRNLFRGTREGKGLTPKGRALGVVCALVVVGLQRALGVLGGIKVGAATEQRPNRQEGGG